MDYYVAYLPEGVSSSDGDSSVFAAAAGSVRLVGGDMTEEWDVDILSDAFLDTSGRFFVKLNSTALVEGGMPKLASRSLCISTVKQLCVFY